MPGARPSSYRKGGGGGFLNNVDATIVGYEFTDDILTKEGRQPYEPRTYKDTKTGRMKPSFHWMNAIVDFLVDGAAEPVQKLMRVGAFDAFSSIEDDGHTLVPVNENYGQGSNIDWGLFTDSLCTPAVGKGFPEELLPEDELNWSNIIGTRVRLVQRVNEEANKKFGKRKDATGEEKYDRTDLVVEEVYQLPGTKAASKGAQKAASTSNGAGKVAPQAAKANGKANGKAHATDELTSEELDALCSSTLMEVLAEAGKPMQKGRLTLPIHEKLDGNPYLQQVYNRCRDDNFLAMEDGWTYNKAKQTLALQ